MAINWSVGEAARELAGVNKENIMDIGSRFPLFSNLVMKALGGDKEAFVMLMEAVPKTTARVMEMALKAGTKDKADDADTDEDVAEDKEVAPKVEEPEEEKKPAKKGKKEPAKDEKKAPDKRGKKAAPKVEETEDEDEDWGDDEEEEKDPYAGKSAKQLFDMCKKRGIKAKPRQTPDAYVKLLKKADVEAEADEDEEDDDEWEI